MKLMEYWKMKLVENETSEKLTGWMENEMIEK